MAKKTDQNPTEDLKLAAAYPTSKLKGWLSKQLDIPPGRQGIALFRNGKHTLFNSGENQVLTDLDRFKGDGAGFWAGYVPKTPFNATVNVTNLVSADDVLLDMSLLCLLKVSDPVQFFTEVVIPRREIPLGTYQVDAPEIFQAFAKLFRDYAAQDLVDGLIDTELVTKAYAVINPSLNSQGLSLDVIELITCWKREDRPSALQQVSGLEQQLTQQSFRDELNQAAGTASVAEKLKSKGINLPGRARLIKQEKDKPEAESAALLEAWLEGIKNDDQPGKNFRVRSLLVKKELDLAKTRNSSHYKPNWWVPRALWIAFVLILAAAISYFLSRASETMKWAGESEFYITIWLFALGAVLESVVALFKDWERLFEQDIDNVDAIGLDQYRIKDRAQVNRLVQDQSAMEMKLQGDILNELRGRVYQAGNMDLAIEMRRVEQKLQDFESKIRTGFFGNPPYLNETYDISEKTWNTAMDNEEILLIQAALLTDSANKMQLKFAQNTLELVDLKDYESDLDVLYKGYAVRERVLHTQELDN